MKTMNDGKVEMFYERDSYLHPYARAIRERYMQTIIRRDEIAGYGGRIADHVNNHLYYGVHKEGGEWCFREYAPNARRIYVTGDFNGWRKLPEYAMKNIGNGNWELRVAADKVRHGEFFKWFVEWDGGCGERLAALESVHRVHLYTQLLSERLTDRLHEIRELFETVWQAGEAEKG